MKREPSTLHTRKFATLKIMFRSLRYRNYRLFFGGQSISLIGTCIQRIALPWLVYRLSGSPFLLGLVGFSGQIPTFLLSPFAGVVTDRWNRHRIEASGIQQKFVDPLSAKIRNRARYK